jgi:hypothetical protein
MFQLLLFITLPLILIMFVATVTLHLYLGWAIRRDVRDILTELFEDAYQEGRQELARTIATPGGKE